MKWNERRPKKLKKGETRIKKGFLLFPKNIGGEIRWLEFAKWEQMVIVFRVWGDHSCHNEKGWDNTDWID